MQTTTPIPWLAACLLLVCACAHAGQNDDSAEPQVPALHALYVPAQGWAYRDASGQLTGVTVEILRAFAAWLADQHALEPELVFEAESDWSAFYARVRDGSGALFGLGNVTITDQRAEELAFSPPYLYNVAVLIAPSAAATSVQPADMGTHFAGLSALAFAETLHEQRLRSLARTYWPSMPIDRARSNDEIVAAVSAGTHFAYLDAYNYYRAREQGKSVERHPAFDDPGEAFGIIMPLDNPWREDLERFFMADGGLLESDWYAALLADHLGPGVAQLLAPAQ